MTDLPLPSFSVSPAGRQNCNHSASSCNCWISVWLRQRARLAVVQDLVWGGALCKATADILISVTAVTAWSSRTQTGAEVDVLTSVPVQVCEGHGCTTSQRWKWPNAWSRGPTGHPQNCTFKASGNQGITHVRWWKRLICPDLSESVSKVTDKHGEQQYTYLQHSTMIIWKRDNCKLTSGLKPFSWYLSPLDRSL